MTQKMKGTSTTQVLKKVLLSVLLLLTCQYALAQNQLKTSIQIGHTGRVGHLSFINNDQQLVSGASDGYFIIWDVKTGVEMYRTQVEGKVTKFAISKDGQFVAIPGRDRVDIWSVKQGELKQTLDFSAVTRLRPNYITSLTYSPDGKKVYAASNASRIFVADVNDNKPARQLLYDNVGDGGITSLAISPDGSKLLVGTDSYPGAYTNAVGDENLILREAESGKLIKVLKGHKRKVGSVGFSSNGKYLLSAEGDRFTADRYNDRPHDVYIWDAQTGAFLRSIEEHNDDVSSATFSADSKYVISSSVKGLVTVNAVSTGQRVQAFSLAPDDAHYAAISSNNRYVVISKPGAIAFFTMTPKFVKWFNGKIDKINDATFSPDGKRLYTVHGGISTLNDNSFRTWDLANGALEKVQRGGAAPFGSVAVSQDGQRFITPKERPDYKDSEGTYLWEKGQDNAITRFTGHDNTIYTTDISNDGKFAFTMGRNRDDDKDLIYVWNLDTKKVKHAKTLAKINYTGYGGFSEDSRYFYATDDDYVKIWNIADGKLYKNVSLTFDEKEGCGTGKSVSSVFMHPDSKHMLYGCSGGTAIIQNFHTTTVVNTFKIHDKNIKEMEVAPDGSTVISRPFRSSPVKIWNMNNGDIYHVLEKRAQSIAISPKNHQVALDGQDNGLSIYNYKTGEELVRLYALPDQSNYLWTTPEGYFYRTKGTDGLVYFTAGDQIYGFDQFDLKFNRPDIILSRLGYADPGTIKLYKKAWEKRVRKMGFSTTEVMNANHMNLPEITLKTDKDFLDAVTDQTFTISFKASDKENRISRLLIQVNGVPIYGMKGKSLLSLNKKSLDYTAKFPLSQGVNKIDISVMNERGISSLSEELEVTYNPAVKTKPDLHVIAIGVSEFKQDEYNLTYADKDARDLTDLFKSVKGYQNVHTHTLTNEEVTPENVMALRTALEQTKVDDEVIVFVASHGLLDDDLDYYIAAHNTVFDNPAVGGLRYDKLEGLIDGIPARNKLMLLDACHSGEVDKEEMVLTSNSTATPGTNLASNVTTRGFKLVESKSKSNSIGLKSSFELMQELFSDIRRNNGANVISSASGQEYAYESPGWKNGVFTYSLINGIRNQKTDLNNDGKTVVSELKVYVNLKVKELTNGKQNPTSRAVNLSNDFVVWRK